MIAGVVREPSVARARAILEEGVAGADLLELRLDAIEGIRLEDLDVLLAEPRPKLIVTLRRPSDQGGYDGPEGERLAILARAATLGADLVDVELDAIAGLGDDFPRDRLLASHHDWNETPADLDDLLARLEATEAAVLKLVTTARAFTDNERVLALPSRASRPLIALCMGDEGRVSRLLAPRAGSYLTFAAASADRASAPGQWTARELVDRFDLGRLGRETDIYGLVGHRIDYSLGPTVHNRVFRELGLDAAYVLFDVTEPRAVIDAADRLGIRGLSVTIPHKESVIEAVDEIDDAAREIGAVNTIVRGADGRCVGSNTDGPAVVAVLERGLASTGRDESDRVLILGAGGVARAVAWAVRRLGLEGWIASRTREKGVALGDAFGLEWIDWEARQDVAASIVCNATPLGAPGTEEISPYAVQRSRPTKLLFDSVYIPHRTRFLEDGRRAGSVVATGLEMFLHQAAAQSRMWTGEDRTAWFLGLLPELAARTVGLGPVILVGMRGSGKSSVGRELARRLECELADCDRVLERERGTTIREIFERFGEATFREWERETLGSLLERRPGVLATGGGAVLDDENVRAMRQSGVVVYLSAGAETLAHRIESDPGSAASRPALTDLPSSEEVAALLDTRDPRYRAASDVVIDTEGRAPAEVASEILGWLQGPEAQEVRSARQEGGGD